MSQTTTYQVTGMTCGHCVKAVEGALSGLDGVQEVQVDLGAGAVTVTSDAALDVASVASAVDDAGYELVP
jgi:copper ion binding protein